MKLQVHNQLEAKLDEYAHTAQLSDTIFQSFHLHWGYRIPLSATDAVHAIAALLESHVTRPSENLSPSEAFWSEPPLSIVHLAVQICWLQDLIDVQRKAFVHDKLRLSPAMPLMNLTSEQTELGDCSCVASALVAGSHPFSRGHHIKQESRICRRPHCMREHFTAALQASLEGSESWEHGGHSAWPGASQAPAEGHPVVSILAFPVDFQLKWTAISSNTKCLT